MIGALYFGPTSELYKRLVVAEQKVDTLSVNVPANFDSSLFTILARVKTAADTLYVRDQILATVAAARSAMAPAGSSLMRSPTTGTRSPARWTARSGSRPWCPATPPIAARTTR